MSKKRPLAPPASPTDEWGIYDPSKAGMQALFSRLGRPILRAGAASERRERKRASRPDRPAEGVGMAIQEARRRAGLITAANAAPVPAPEPPPTPPPAAPVPVPEVEARAAVKSRVKAAKTGRRKPLGDAVVAAGALADAGAAHAAVPPPPAPASILPPLPAADEASAGRAVRKTARTRQTVSATAAPPPPKAAPAMPPPSPRRPRGAVPLAAWAHAVSDTPRPEPKRSEAKGLWRGIFRIPSEVALVEYGRGCRIHRLVIETAPDGPVDPF
jgi:hypothetical protein